MSKSDDEMISYFRVKLELYCTRTAKIMCVYFLSEIDSLCAKVKFKQNSTVVQINNHVQQSRRHGVEPTVPSADTDRANSQLKHLLRFWAN